MKNILLEHYQNYPLMTIEDYIKLIHQSVFGPKHFSSQPNQKDLMQYLEKEIEIMSKIEKTSYLDQIGFGYYRVDINAIHFHFISKETLIESFYKSMQRDVKKEEAIIVMNQMFDTLIALIRNQEIPLDFTQSETFIAQYQSLGYPAIHHSEIYRINYAPHYRVIHQNDLNITMLQQLKGD